MSDDLWAKRYAHLAATVRRVCAGRYGLDADEEYPVSMLVTRMARDISVLEKDLRECRQALAIAEWQPIDTAPRDGTPILLGSPNGDASVCRWGPALGLGCPAGWRNIGIPFGVDKWMPLPGGPDDE